MKGMETTAPRGVALVLVLLVTSLLSVMALGLAVVVSSTQLVQGNFADGIAALYAAEAGVELAARELARQPSWDAVLAGTALSAAADGQPTGSRAVPGGGTISLQAETNQLNCGRSTACTSAQMAVSTAERPWGSNNPVWRLFLFGRVEDIIRPARPVPGYLLVWIGDDPRETDDNPLVDGSSADGRGRRVVRVRAEVFGRAGARRAVEAELARMCRPEAELLVCRPGIRVQSWREVRQLIP
jgi:hypothetical protein